MENYFEYNYLPYYFFPPPFLFLTEHHFFYFKVHDYIRHFLSSFPLLVFHSLLPCYAKASEGWLIFSPPFLSKWTNMEMSNMIYTWVHNSLSPTLTSELCTLLWDACCYYTALLLSMLILCMKDAVGSVWEENAWTQCSQCAKCRGPEQVSFWSIPGSDGLSKTTSWLI